MKLKKLTSIAVILFMTILYIGFSNSDKWILFESIKYGFKIEFPREPTAKTQSVNTEIGFLKLNFFIYDASNNKKEDNLVYGVITSEYPDTLINSSKTEILDEFFRNSIAGAVNNVHGKLLSEKVITISEYPGREIRVDFQNGKAVITSRIFLVENRMYMIQTISKTNKDFNNSIYRFLDSFELI